MDSKQRFSNRVESYVKYRPGYPKEMLDALYANLGIGAASSIADVGAGTGIFSKLLLERGSQVIAVEPNTEMREAANEALGGHAGYRSIQGSAEETGLPDQSVDFIVCAQSFHWFDQGAAQVEFRRILKPEGKVALIWNTRLTEGTVFLEGYEQLLKTYGTDYQQVNHRNLSSEALSSFFKTGEMQEARFTNRQIFDYDGVSGRLSSSSYTPTPVDPRYTLMMKDLESLFERTKHNGTVFFDYETEVFWGGV